MKRVTLTADPVTAAKLDARGNAQLQQLVSSTPQQVDAWLTANVTNLAQARDAFRIVLLGLRYLLRKDAT